MTTHEIDRDKLLDRAATQFGTPAYVYFTEEIADQFERLRVSFGNRFALSYAVKSNPNPAILEWMLPRLDSLDISSVGEMRLALRAGWKAEDISFTGPGKRDAEIQESIEAGLGELVLESVEEAQVADGVARALGRVQDVLVRISPSTVPKGFGDQMAGRPTAFGIDLEKADEALPRILELRNLRIIGLHIYSGTQCLVPEAICGNYRNFLTIFDEICGRYDFAVKKLVFGSGLGIRYFDRDQSLDLDEVASGIISEIDEFRSRPRFRNTKLVLELGRYLIGEAGYFLTKVLRVKESRGVRIAICDGGMNGHLSASGNLGMVIHRNYLMHKVGGGEPDQKVTLAGPLCTPLDRIGVGVELPSLSPGDLIAVHSSGAYGLTLSPVHFISHPVPREVLVEGSQFRDVSRVLSDLG